MEQPELFGDNWEGPEVGPFGSIGSGLVRCAEHLVEYFSEDLEWSPGDPLVWEDADDLALMYWLEFDSGIPLMAMPFEFTGDFSARLYDTVLAIRTALPFNEAERAWLYDGTRGKGDPGLPETLPERFEHLEGTIMVAGIRRPVSGHDMMSRWLAWRRQTDEYQGQGSLDQARDALMTMKELLS
jgi:hypothetical protein